MTYAERVERARRFLASIEKNHSPTALASSFGAEDMVVLDLIARDGLAIGIFTLDTGRLPRETHELMAKVRDRYGIGIDGFYDGVDQRVACCNVRKVEPLRRALAGKRGWITGLRREQAASRAAAGEVEHDAVNGKWKFSPLVEWTNDDVWRYLRDNRVPYNALHDRGYPSIGCEPCTRAVKPGEHPRAGRWWWEQDAAGKECGLHAIPVRVVETA